MKDQGAEAALVEGLEAVFVSWALPPDKLLRGQVAALIAADAPRVLRVLLEARLPYLENGAATIHVKDVSGKTVTLLPRVLLSLLAPEVTTND